LGWVLPFDFGWLQRESLSRRNAIDANALEIVQRLLEGAASSASAEQVQELERIRRQDLRGATRKGS